MPDPLAIWGAATGTVGLGLAARQEMLASRRRLVVSPGVSLTVSRTEPRRLLGGWALIQVFNGGRRDLAIEHVGFRYFALDAPGVASENAKNIASGESVDALDHKLDAMLPAAMLELRAEIDLSDAMTVLADGPSRKVYTPLGPMLAAGMSAFAPVQAFAITTGDREWRSPPQPLIGDLPWTTDEHLTADLGALAARSAAAPELSGLLWLTNEDPYLAEE